MMYLGVDFVHFTQLLMYYFSLRSFLCFFFFFLPVLDILSHYLLTVSSQFPLFSTSGIFIKAILELFHLTIIYSNFFPPPGHQQIRPHYCTLPSMWLTIRQTVFRPKEPLSRMAPAWFLLWSICYKNYVSHKRLGGFPNSACLNNSRNLTSFIGVFVRSLLL